MLQLDKKIRRLIESFGITPHNPLFQKMVRVRNRYLTPLRERYGRIKVWWESTKRNPLNPLSRSELDAYLTQYGLEKLETVKELLPRAETDQTAAERLVLALLLDRPALRKNFPQSLRQGEHGPLAKWLQGDGARELGLGEGAIKNIRAAFARRPSSCVRKLYDHHNNLRERMPHALAAPYWAPFGEWLIRSGIPGHGIKPEDVIWFLIESAEDPSLGILDAWLRSREWQERWPQAFRPGGCPRFSQELPELETGFKRCRNRWNLDSAARVEPLDGIRRMEGNAPGQGQGPGLNIIGHFCYPSGLREAAVQMARAVIRAGGGLSMRDFPASIEADMPIREEYLGLEHWPVTAFVLSPDQDLETVSWWSGLRMPQARDRVAMWYWELEEVPEAWVPRARQYREIWAPTRFIAEAMRKTLDVPVVDLLPGVELEPMTPLPRSHFGLPEGEFLFLFMFDMCSVFDRKNPMAAVEAFSRAFPQGGPRLVVKVNRGTFNPEALATLKEGLAKINGILLDGTYTRNEAYALMACADAYISLHRSEGFGLTMAEAMLMEKPVIATGYSGNLDFMDANTACLIPYSMIPLEKTHLVYRKGMMWADPHVAKAAEAMRWVVNQPDQAKTMAMKGRAHVRSVLGLQAAGRRFLERAKHLQEESNRTRKAA